MGTLQVANIHLESTANNRIQYGGTNNINIIVGSTTALVANTTQVTALLPINVGSNVSVNTSTIFVGNSTINTSITSNTLRIGNSSATFTIASNGNVGIGGNTTPTLDLYVNGAAAGAVGTLSDGANVAVDLSTFNNFTLTLNGARNLDNPTNLIVGQSGVIWVSQNSTGGQTLSYGSFWKFPANTAPTLTSTASAVDALVYSVRTSTSITVQAILNVG